MTVLLLAIIGVFLVLRLPLYIVDYLPDWYPHWLAWYDWCLEAYFYELLIVLVIWSVYCYIKQGYPIG